MMWRWITHNATRLVQGAAVVAVVSGGLSLGSLVLLLGVSPSIPSVDFLLLLVVEAFQLLQNRRCVQNCNDQSLARWCCSQLLVLFEVNENKRKRWLMISLFSVILRRFGRRGDFQHWHSTYLYYSYRSVSIIFFLVYCEQQSDRYSIVNETDR